jgi:hypothetical protein
MFLDKPEIGLSRSMSTAARTRQTGGDMLVTCEQLCPDAVPGDPFRNGPEMWRAATGYPSSRPATLVCGTAFTVDGCGVRAFGPRSARVWSHSVASFGAESEPRAIERDCTTPSR